MSEITGTLRVVLLLAVSSYRPVCSGWYDPSRVFLEPVMYKKSCRDGMVANQDYFVVKGLVNISNIDKGDQGETTIYFRNKWRQSNDWILESELYLKGATCRETNTVKINSCTCTFMDSQYVRILCNLTAKTIYSRTNIFLVYVRGGWKLSPSIVLPPVYATPVCIGPSVNRAKSHPGSFSAVLGPGAYFFTEAFSVVAFAHVFEMAHEQASVAGSYFIPHSDITNLVKELATKIKRIEGTALLGTAVVCLVSSIISSM